MLKMDPKIDPDMDQLRQFRSTAKGNVTIKAHKLNELMNSKAETEVVKNALQELLEV